jgi:hypothetical protein
MPPGPKIRSAAAESEALRRLNASLGERTDRREYQRVIKQVVARHLSDTTPTAGRMSLPPEHHLWAAKRAREMVDELAERRYHVVGDLGDLVPDPGQPPSGRVPDGVNDAEVLDASTRAATAATGRLAEGRALRVPRAPETEIGLRQRLASRARGMGHRLRRKVATSSPHNRAVARAVTAYRRVTLRRRSSRRSSRR